MDTIYILILTTVLHDIIFIFYTVLYNMLIANNI